MYRNLAASATAILLLVPVFASAALPDPTTWIPDPTADSARWVENEITTPLEGAEVGGVLRIEGKAIAAQGYAVRFVQIYVDGVNLGQADGTEAWSFPLDTRTLVDGDHAFQAIAVATPAATPIFVISIGGTAHAKFRTLNDQLGVKLLDETIDLAQAHAGGWIIPIHKDYTGLRVTIEGVSNRLLEGPKAELVLAYKDTPDKPSTRIWVITYGVLGASGFLSRPPHGVLAAPGVLTLNGAFVGEGTVRVLVEAVEVPPR